MEIYKYFFDENFLAFTLFILFSMHYHRSPLKNQSRLLIKIMDAFL